MRAMVVAGSLLNTRETHKTLSVVTVRRAAGVLSKKKQSECRRKSSDQDHADHAKYDPKDSSSVAGGWNHRWRNNRWRRCFLERPHVHSRPIENHGLVAHFSSASERQRIRQSHHAVLHTTAPREHLGTPDGNQWIGHDDVLRGRPTLGHVKDVEQCGPVRLNGLPSFVRSVVVRPRRIIH